MAEKHLTETAWKAYAKGKDYKDGGLLKALAAIEKAQKAGPAAQVDAFDELEKQVDLLRKAHKSDKELAAYLGEIDKTLTSERKTAEQAVRAAQAASEDENDESPALLTTQMIPLLRQVRKGDVVMKALIAVAGKETAVLVSRRGIPPSRRKLLVEFLGVSGGVKYIVGDCLFEANAVTFVVMSQAAGLAKKLKAALLNQTEMRLKVRVRGEDPDDIDEEGEEAEETEEPEDLGAGAGSSAATAPPSPDADSLKLAQRLAKLELLIVAMTKARRGDTARMRALADFAREKAGSGNPDAGMKALDALELLLRTAASPPPPSSPEGPVNEVEPGAAFNARLAALMGSVRAFIAAAGPTAGDLKRLVGEAGASAGKREFERAHALLDEAEELLSRQADADHSPSKGEPTPDGARRAEFDTLSATLEADLEAAGRVRLDDEQAGQLRQARTAWGLAGEAAAAGNYERALLIARRLAASGLLGRLAQAAGASPDRGRIVRQRQFLLQRWARIPGELRAQLQALRQNVGEAEADEDPDELVDGIQDALEELLDDLQEEIDDAINAGDSSVFAGLRQQLQGHALVKHLQDAPDFDGSSMLRSVQSALDEIEQAMTA